jgi:hypothetical protein
MWWASKRPHVGLADCGRPFTLSRADANAKGHGRTINGPLAQKYQADTRP